MFLPTFNDNICILVNNLLYLLIVIGFDSLFFEQLELRTIPYKLSHTAITLYIYV